MVNQFIFAVLIFGVFALLLIYPFRLKVTSKNGGAARLNWFPSVGIYYRPKGDRRRLTLRVASLRIPVLLHQRPRDKGKKELHPPAVLDAAKPQRNFFRYIMIHDPKLLLLIARKIKRTWRVVPRPLATCHLSINFFPSEPLPIVAIFFWREMLSASNVSLGFRFEPGSDWTLQARLSPLALLFFLAAGTLQLPFRRIMILRRRYRTVVAGGSQAQRDRSAFRIVAG